MSNALERTFNKRLYYMVEIHDWINIEQAGFHKNRSGEDQVLRHTQSIGDQYQATKPKKTVLALLDYSKAFGRAWRKDLLIRAIGKGLPIAYAQWLRDFFSNRKAEVQISGDKGLRIQLRQGIPHGSVLSPLLFQLYIAGFRLSYPKRGGGHVCRRRCHFQQPSQRTSR